MSAGNGGDPMTITGPITGIDVAMRCTWPSRKGRGPVCNGFAGRVYVPHGMMARVVDHVQHSGDAEPGLLVLPCAACGRMNVIGFITMEAAG